MHERNKNKETSSTIKTLLFHSLPQAPTQTPLYLDCCHFIQYRSYFTTASLHSKVILSTGKLLNNVNWKHQNCKLKLISTELNLSRK